MQAFFKSKARLSVVVSLVIVMQFCCCVLPVGWQIQKDNPAIRQTMERIELRLAELPSVSTWLASR